MASAGPFTLISSLTCSGTHTWTGPVPFLRPMRRSGIGDPIGPEDQLDQDLIDRLAISPEEKARLAALVSSALPADAA